jgi:hypothetical protein
MLQGRTPMNRLGEIGNNSGGTANRRTTIVPLQASASCFEELLKKAGKTRIISRSHHLMPDPGYDFPVELPGNGAPGITMNKAIENIMRCIKLFVSSSELHKICITVEIRAIGCLHIFVASGSPGEVSLEIIIDSDEGQDFLYSFPNELSMRLKKRGIRNRIVIQSRGKEEIFHAI